MRRFIWFLAATMACGHPLPGQQSPAAPQTARQALMEMFFSKTPGTFLAHLPGATRAALEKSGALAMLQQYSQMAAQLPAQGQNVQTFETGSVMLTGHDPKTGDKFDMTVESDTLNGDRDDIAVTFQSYKSGQVQRTPFMPLLTFTMQKESQVWTLNEVSLTIHVPLADPDFLKAFTEKLHPQTMPPHALTQATFTPRSETASQAATGDTLVIAAMRTILAAEVTYASKYPNAGFACTLSSLDSFGSGEVNEHQAMLINSGLAGGKKYGYVFTLSECSGSPATSFHLTAAPGANLYGRKTFCSDESNVVRESGSAAECIASGAPVQ